MRGRTTFVIAHRLSTIRRADQILVVEGGRIVERGTHGSLYALGGRYFELYTKQHGLQANLFLAPGEGDSIPAEGSALARPENGNGSSEQNEGGELNIAQAANYSGAVSPNGISLRRPAGLRGPLRPLCARAPDYLRAEFGIRDVPPVVQ